jgi:hypothetical protein
VSVQPGTTVVSPTNRVEVTFSAAVNPATLNAGAFTLRSSPDATFFDGNDTVLTDTDGIDWDANALTATFNTASDFADGYYLIELDGDAGGITSTAGRALDGEWLDSDVNGGTLFSLWQDTPSGDGFAGGDYRAMFVVDVDTVAPTVDASRFAYATAPHALSFDFSENVGASLSVADLVLQNLTTSTTIPSASISLDYDAGTNAATFAFPGFANGILPDGRYRATLGAAGITDRAGNALAANHVFEFTFLIGDANADGQVNLSDFNILAANFGQSPRDFTQGDFTYNGTVNLDDFNLLASRFGASVAPASVTGRPGSSLPARGIGRTIGMSEDERRDALADLLS